LDGAVESSIRLGIADVIADVVETGTTLREAGLEPFGDPIMTSQAVLFSRPDMQLDEVTSHPGGSRAAGARSAGGPRVRDSRLRPLLRPAGAGCGDHPRLPVADGLAAARR